MEGNKTIVLVLRSGGDFTFKDVELITRHINSKWSGKPYPQIICLYDKASMEYDLGNIKVIPLPTNQPGTWSRIHLYSPEMDKYRPFLYIDLDTVIVKSLENIFSLIRDESKFIALEDFWQKGKLATALVWFPKNCAKVHKVYQSFNGASGKRMDTFLRKNIKADVYWQQLTNTIHDFKSKSRKLLQTIPIGADLICFHGKPRIHNAQHIQWVKDYVQYDGTPRKEVLPVTVIIPYKEDRGWLKYAIQSVPPTVQLILSQGEGNWASNFNKALQDATGAYIRWLHEDDMLTENSIDDSLHTFETGDYDFIHGRAYTLFNGSGNMLRWKPQIINPTLADMLNHNYMHSMALMYRREVFDKIGGLDETLHMAEEYEFNLRCLKAGLKLGYCDALLAYYRKHPKQNIRTSDPSLRRKERQQFKQKYAQ